MTQPDLDKWLKPLAEKAAASSEYFDVDVNIILSTFTQPFLDLLNAETGAALREAVQVLWDRTGREEYGHAKAAVVLDIEAVEALITPDRQLALDRLLAEREAKALDWCADDLQAHCIHAGDIIPAIRVIRERAAETRAKVEKK